MVAEHGFLDYYTWLSPGTFTGLPRGHYRAAFELYWSSRGVYHWERVANLRFDTELNESSPVSYCSLQADTARSRRRLDRYSIVESAVRICEPRP